MSSETTLTLAKYSGAGNDFLVVDERDRPGWSDGAAAARALCRRGTSIGADGLVLVSRSGLEPGAVARMRLWNADGSAAEFSGNAARCVLRHLAEQGEIAGEALLQTDIGLVRGSVEGTLVSQIGFDEYHWLAGQPSHSLKAFNARVRQIVNDDHLVSAFQ